MPKLKIYATGNESLKGDFNISYYIVEKDKNFLEWLGDLLAEVLEMEIGKAKAKFIFKEKFDENKNPLGEEIYAKEISKMVDIHEHYENKGDRIDIFYGKNRAYMTFRKSKEKREKFAKFLLKTKEWIIVKEVPALPNYIGKRIR